MTPRHRVGISQYLVTPAPALLVAHGLGSCVGIALYDPENRVGGLAHTLLPSPRPGTEILRPGKFADTAIRTMVEDLLRLGACRESLWAKLAGGANMFEQLLNTADEGVGARNVRSARETLEAQAIPLMAEDTGGNYGRTLEFDLATGAVRIRTIRGGDTAISL
jgi:chemotaxis protein CheD